MKSKKLVGKNKQSRRKKITPKWKYKNTDKDSNLTGDSEEFLDTIYQKFTKDLKSGGN